MTTRHWILGLAATALLGANALAETESGNEIARRLMYGQKGQEKAMEKDAAGKVCFFRYMLVKQMTALTNSTPTTYQFTTVDPGSGMYAEFLVTKKESLKLAETVKEGESLALVARIKTISKANNKIGLESAILRYKDRPAPKAGKELLSDIDPNARLGTDNRSGDEQIIKGK